MTRRHSHSPSQDSLTGADHVTVRIDHDQATEPHGTARIFWYVNNQLPGFITEETLDEDHSLDQKIGAITSDLLTGVWATQLKDVEFRA